ncbi:MAG TPA: PQQ-binding-like beta-propeller repeat protein [Actinomycetota bacterium]|nr:PQQ-binding-like beta-propeller repeat protein [Actinomycetota bacterium]
MSVRPPDVLERAFGAPPAGPALEAVLARRRRRDRRQRIVAALVALGLTLAGVALLVHAYRSAQVVPSGPITPKSVSGLKLAWWGEVNSSIHANPVIADGRVFVTTQDGRVVAFDEACEATQGPCPPVWGARISDPNIAGNHNPWGAPVAVGGRIYVGSQDGRLLGYPTDCVGGCAPTWVGQTSGSLAEASIAQAEGILYVNSMSGTVYGFPEACDSYPTPCQPLWTYQMSGGTNGGGPVVVGDTVYAGTVAGHVYAFPTSCAQTGPTCEPLWDTETGGPIGTDLASDGRSVFVPVGHQVEAFPTDCGSTCAPNWIGPTTGHVSPSQPGYVQDAISSMAVFPGGLVVGNGAATIQVFPTDCGTGGHICQPIATLKGNDTFSDPSVANGVLFVGFGQGVQAYDLACLEHGGSAQTCPALWTSVPGGAVTADPQERDNSLYNVDESGRVYRNSLTGEAEQPPPPPADVDTVQPVHTPPSSALPSVVVVVLLVMGGAWWLGRRRARASDADEADDIHEWEDLGPAGTD